MMTNQCTFPWNMLDRLPKYVLLNFIRSWLGIDDTCKVDTAICCHKFRNAFLGLLENSPTFVFDNFYLDYQYNQLEMLEWLMSRNLHVNRLCLTEQLATVSVTVKKLLAT